MLKQLTGSLILVFAVAGVLGGCSAKKEVVDRETHLPPEAKYVSPKGFYAVKYTKRPWEFSEMRKGRIYYTSNLDESLGKLKIAYTDLKALPKPPYDVKKQNEILDEDTKILAEHLNAKLDEVKKLEVQGCPARDSNGTLQKGIMLGGNYRARLLISGRRLYELTAVGNKDFVVSPVVNEFFSSFEIPNLLGAHVSEEEKPAPTKP